MQPYLVVDRDSQNCNGDIIPFFYNKKLYRTYGAIGDRRVAPTPVLYRLYKAILGGGVNVTWVAPTPILYRLYKAI